MIRIIAVSDNHGYLEPIQEILNKNQNADFYLHLGDCCCDPNLLKPFVCVCGNNDYSYDLPDYRVIEIDNKNRVYMTHSHKYTFNREKMIEDAKYNNCNIILFGHTHVFSNSSIDNIELINPGSCLYNRDQSKPCYAEIIINGSDIKVNRIEIESSVF